MPVLSNPELAAREWLLHRPFRSDGGVAWIADLPPELQGQTDNNELPRRSPLRLLEDGRELGPAHALHAEIREAGDGRYSFWGNVLYLSASDGSDPNTNGRAYTVVLPAAQPAASAVLKAIAPSAAENKWVAPERTLQCAILGVGNRGQALGRMLSAMAGIKIRWLADLSEARINETHRNLADPEIRETTDFSLPLRDDAVDCVFITLPDHLHKAAAEGAFRAGKHVYLEKPVATTAADAQAILAAWRTSGRILQLGYVLRAAPFYQAVRNVVRQGRIGPVRIVSLSEQLSVAHGASFMRRWHAQASRSGGLMVHKSCHDLDLACWLLDSRPRSVSSVGGSDTFRRPAPAPFCSQCEERAACSYADTGRYERRSAPERADPTAFGLDRCVFGLDKEIVDNQVVTFEMENRARGSYFLAMQGPRRSERRITLIGDDGRLDGIFEDRRFTVTFTDAGREPMVWNAGRQGQGSHGGGDSATVIRFLNACAGRAGPPIKKVSDAMAGLVFALAAERARTSGNVVRLSAQDFQLARPPLSAVGAS